MNSVLASFTPLLIGPTVNNARQEADDQVLRCPSSPPPSSLSSLQKPLADFSSLSSFATTGTGIEFINKVTSIHLSYI